MINLPARDALILEHTRIATKELRAAADAHAAAYAVYEAAAAAAYAVYAAYADTAAYAAAAADAAADAVAPYADAGGRRRWPWDASLAHLTRLIEAQP